MSDHQFIHGSTPELYVAIWTCRKIIYSRKYCIVLKWSKVYIFHGNWRNNILCLNGNKVLERILSRVGYKLIHFCLISHHFPSLDEENVEPALPSLYRLCNIKLEKKNIILHFVYPWTKEVTKLFQKFVGAALLSGFFSIYTIVRRME